MPSNRPLIPVRVVVSSAIVSTTPDTSLDEVLAVEATLRGGGVSATVVHMIVLVVLVALLLGGLLGALVGRGRTRATPSQRAFGSDRVDVQAGWRNMHGG